MFSAGLNHSSNALTILGLQALCKGNKGSMCAIRHKGNRRRVPAISEGVTALARIDGANPPTMAKLSKSHLRALSLPGRECCGGHGSSKLETDGGETGGRRLN